MKNFPLPSFFKIRLVALIVGFILVCFLLGAARSVFAAYPGSEIRYYTTCSAGSWYEYTAASTVLHYSAVPSFDVGNGVWIDENTNEGIPLWDKYWSGYPCVLVATYCDGGVWNPIQSDALVWFYKGNPIAGYSNSPPPAEDCLPPPDCTQQRADLVAQCDGDVNIINWDDQECTGDCKPDCTDAYANLLTACGGRQFIEWFDDTTCLGECVTCDDIREHCESLGINVSDASSFRCTDDGYWETNPSVPPGGGIEMGQYWHIGIDAQAHCGFDSGFDPENPGPDDPPKDPPSPDPPADRPCSELEADCIEVCNAHVKYFQCTEGGTYRCQCTDDVPGEDPTPNPGDPEETPPDTGDDPPAGDPGPGGTDPDGTNDNALLGDIVDNTKVIADNTKRTGDILQTELNKLNATGTDISNKQGVANSFLSQIEAAINSANGWLKKIEDALDDGFDVDVEGTDVSGIENRLDDIKDILDDDFTEIGSGNPTEAYSPSDEVFNIGERFDTFISRIRNTGVFALPNDFFNAPPSGGSPIFTFEFGSYGTRTVDLSDMSQPLLILRTIVLIAFCFVCLRVVILKR